MYGYTTIDALLKGTSFLQTKESLGFGYPVYTLIRNGIPGDVELFSEGECTGNLYSRKMNGSIPFHLPKGDEKLANRISEAQERGSGITIFCHSFHEIYLDGIFDRFLILVYSPELSEN